MRQAVVSVSMIKPEKVQLHALIEETLDILQPDISKNTVVVEKLLTPRDVVIKFSSTHFLQVMINLVSNTIRVLEKQDGKRIILRETEQTDNQVFVRVSDNGSGIPLVKEKYIFEPFFTTKPGVGMGMGLYVVKRLLSFYEGTIKYYRKEG